MESHSVESDKKAKECKRWHPNGDHVYNICKISMTYLMGKMKGHKAVAREWIFRVHTIILSVG